MPKVSMMGSIVCHEGKAEEMQSVLDATVEAVCAEEGVEIYSYHRAEGDVFWFFALMADESALQNHGRSPAMQAAMAEVMPLMAQPPQISQATPIAAVGFDL